MFMVQNQTAVLEAAARTMECHEHNFNLVLIVLYLHCCT